MKNDKIRDVRKYAAEALGNIGDNKAVEPLCEALKYGDSHVRSSAAEALKIPERFQSLGVDIENKNLYIGPGRNIILKGVYRKVFEPEQEETGPFYNCIAAEPYKEDRENLVLFYSHTKGDYRAFSNFYPSEIEIDGKTYQTVEHYFQACKATDEEDHEKVRLAGNPYKTKELGKSIRRRDDWEDIKFGIMKKGCYAKFTRYKDLMKLLLSTGDLAIHENTLNDLEWGWFDNKGEDKLGRVLTEVREEIRKNADTGAIYIEDEKNKDEAAVSSPPEKKKLSFNSETIHAGNLPSSSAVPIYHAVTVNDKYQRYTNPTTNALEEKVRTLE